MKNPQSIEEACEIVETYKSFKDESFGKPAAGAVRMKAVKFDGEYVKREVFDEFKNEMQSSMDKKLGEITSMLRRGLTANRYQDAGNRTFKRKNMSTVECYRCHEIRHYATDCPM